MVFASAAFQFSNSFEKKQCDTGLSFGIGWDIAGGEATMSAATEAGNNHDLMEHLPGYAAGFIHQAFAE